MPMRVARVVLLETATDLGAAGVDPVYGHGHLNVEAAMTAAGTFTVSATAICRLFHNRASTCQAIMRILPPD